MSDGDAMGPSTYSRGAKSRFLIGQYRVASA